MRLESGRSAAAISPEQPRRLGLRDIQRDLVSNLMGENDFNVQDNEVTDYGLC